MALFLLKWKKRANFWFRFSFPNWDCWIHFLGSSNPEHWTDNNGLTRKEKKKKKINSNKQTPTHRHTNKLNLSFVGIWTLCFLFLWSFPLVQNKQRWQSELLTMSNWNDKSNQNQLKAKKNQRKRQRERENSLIQSTINNQYFEIIII